MVIRNGTGKDGLMMSKGLWCEQLARAGANGWQS
jgi:hypothetical protein